MKFTVTRNSLLNELNLVQGVIEKKNTVPILANILMEVSGDRLDITATDIDVTIRCGCPVAVAEEGTTTIAARRFFDFVRLLDDDAEIELTLLDNNWVELRSGKSRTKFVAIPKDDFPVIPDAAPTTAVLPGNLLQSMIQRTMFAITQEESRYSLNGSLLVLQPGAVHMVATDGHRLALVSKEMQVAGITDKEVRALIPRKALVELVKMVGDDDVMVEFGTDENHLFFSTGSKRMVARVMAGQFPNYEMVIPKENDKLVVVGTKAFGDGIRRAAIMSDEKLKAIKLSFQTGELELSSNSADSGEAREIVPIEFEGEKIEIGFNSTYLLDFVSACGTESVSIAIKNSDTQGLLRPVGEGVVDYRYVIMPMKL
ncbi:MAG: DNA polymerase III subunit beta [Acidobacteriota bacterium]|jgi:DNA polymerase-3 subunit beta|nr:DNA polymerase III subunit beta [Acidobacteriota bacterium]